MTDREAKNALFDAFAAVGKALSSGRRVEILDLLAQSERSVEEVASAIDQSVANTSHHLRQLAHAGLVRTRRDGVRIYYRLASDRVAQLQEILSDIAAQSVGDVESLAAAYLGDLDGIETISAPELARRLRAGDVVVLDIRPAAEFEAGHISGARSVPIDDLETGLDDIPTDVDVVAYCRGPYCVFAPEAVRELTAQGVNALHFDAGFPRWQRAGFPTDARPRHTS